ncbi:hypothetical protein SDC9_21803 [bioreactor metagenome]|uniref:Uncharacterized protein n=1 Tax=bioreactor metagenome TaxID=1076179 RepID=A0A644UAQ2_9ZZZZ|nr:hypothetical protein [Lentimicrobium sp.]MEA5111554.1 hypothetical protein [Lentimicrobium sp.]
MIIADSEIDKILNINLTEEYWIFQLGVGYIYENSPSNARFFLPYNEYGFKFWNLINYEIHEFLCVDSKPKEWVKELIEGDVRNLIVGILSAITAKYEIGLGIAIPIVALVIKKDLKDYCCLNFPRRKVIDIKDVVKNNRIR